MKPNSLTENHFGHNVHSQPNQYSVSHLQHDNVYESSQYINETQMFNNLQHSPKKSELEKLFSHATEVKGDLESVIQALVGIIGNGSAEGYSNDSFENPTEARSILINNFKNEIPQSKYISEYNTYKWPNDNTPSVNVENVLKTVRANKMKHDKFFNCNEGSQSSGSSKERLADKLDFNNSLQSRSDHPNTFQSMLSDPGHSEPSTIFLPESENPRKHKSQYSTMYKDDQNWNCTDISVKKIKSVNGSVDVNDGATQMQLEHNPMNGDPMLNENKNAWINANQINHNNLYPENRHQFNWNIQEICNSDMRNSNNNANRLPSNYNWNSGNDNMNEFQGNPYADESSCSPWSKISPNHSQIYNSKISTIFSPESKIDKQTPSVSVSDSEGSIEPIRDPPVKRIPRLPSLCTQLRNKQGKYGLVLHNQPEQQHRARYMTEGSRGAVKDRTGNGYPTIQLLGWNQPATLQIFVGSEDGRVKPHNFYQACKITGKQILSCKERIFDNTGLIEVQLEAKENQIVILDCIGILKLRNVDVERRAGIQRIKQKSTMARLVFRVNLPHGDGYFTCLQVSSDPILCTQPVGTPEISKMSLSECSYKGNVELFIIGKNIVKCTQVLFQDYSEHRSLVWQSEAKIDPEYLHQTHLICTVPPYCDDKLKDPITVQVILNCGGRISEPRYFTYLPEIVEIPSIISPTFKFNDWKIEKQNFSETASFSIGDCSPRLEFSNLTKNINVKKSQNEILYDLDYITPNDNSHEVNYSPIYSTNKAPNETSTNSQIRWKPFSGSKTIPILPVSPTHEGFSNSLYSNMGSECMLHASNNISTPQSESVKTHSNPNDIFDKHKDKSHDDHTESTFSIAQVNPTTRIQSEY